VGLSDKLNEKVAEALLEVEKQTAAVALGLAQWQNGARLTGARPLQVAGPSQRLWGGSGRLVGWSLFAANGPVTVLIRDSRVAGDGDVLAAFALADGEDAQQWMGPTGVSFGEGLFVEKTGAGALVGSVWTGTGTAGVGTVEN
jgi:hypothetical protein